MREQLTLDPVVATELAGSEDAVLKALEGHLECDVFLRGNLLTLDGDAAAVKVGKDVVAELSELIAQGHEISPGTIGAVTSALDHEQSPSSILGDVVWTHRSTRVAPKTVNQKRYVDSIRRNTITFGIGPAGTGKTYLAMAMATAALSRRDVNRVILTRPAVEAGERLGFLPGTMMEKVDPYLRPLFDALYDMLEADRVNSYLEKGVIEVAPLAFMRGRAQPLFTPVLTPSGFRPIGELRVGDLVVGSSGRPTPVLGVYPQGRNEVFRLRTQDGATTLCCAEHLWHVITPADRSRGRPGRVVETREMSGRLRAADQHRFELPLLAAPVEFEPRPVPMDPYALGLLLGDGCPTTAITPSFTTADPEPGAVIVANPATVAPPALGLAGTRSSTRFVPETYLCNDSITRLAVLQGLLDSDGGAVKQSGRTCRIEYATRSARLRDDVTFLVRSLGGVADPRGSDAGVIDIRLPGEIEPFRLERKRALYRADGGARPVRFVEEIEPAGATETVCIQVAAADSLYVTEDFLVTHNTLNDSFIILDEAQNTTPEQMKMFLTRLGFNSTMVVTGDITQIDLPGDQRSGLVVVRDILGTVTDIDFVNFTGEDVVRHKLVQRIVNAYAEHAQVAAPELRPARRPPAAS